MLSMLHFTLLESIPEHFACRLMAIFIISVIHITYIMLLCRLPFGKAVYMILVRCNYEIFEFLRTNLKVGCVQNI